MKALTRRQFLERSALAWGGAQLAAAASALRAQDAGERPRSSAPGVEIINPRARVPVSFILDDSTCLVNLNKFALPQFAAAWGADSAYHRYNWREWPDEIPDDFVRRFAAWCGEHGVKGKYSVVPYPACVGRLDRELPGWTAQELAASLELVRTTLTPNWDIHPEMVTHTRVIDLKTGHPYPERSPRFMENWEWTRGRSTDELTDYLRYGLTILKNVGLPCEGITTPGGFGNQVLPELAQATLRACRDVFAAEVPHYFRHLYESGARSVAPRVEYASGLSGPDPRCVVSIIGCTGDWTGGWDCTEPGGADRYLTADLQKGRLVEVITRGEPACLVSHWTGIYFNGAETGFKIFQEVVRRLHQRFDHLIWLKLSEIARYWAAKELTRMARQEKAVALEAPFACPCFTVRISGPVGSAPRLRGAGGEVALKEVAQPLRLERNTWTRAGEGLLVCFDLAKGRSEIWMEG
jgi:hypothetical protein